MEYLNYNNITLKDNKIDYVLSFTAIFQSFLSLLQQYLLYCLHLPESIAGNTRIIGSAIPIIISMIFVLRRNKRYVLYTYIPVAIILLLTNIMWPTRWPYMKDDVLKFLLPIVIPTGLCVASVRNLKVFLNSCFLVSLLSSLLALLFLYSYLSGSYTSDKNYNMAFSYALLFPTAILFSQDNFIWKLLSIVLLIEMLALGSRGALITVLTYMVISYKWNKRSGLKIILYVLLLITATYFLFEPIVYTLTNLFDQIGVNSRSLNLYLNGEVFSHDSGRFDLYEETRKMIDTSPLFGYGIWADREFFGIYCHNIYLELLLDFGYAGGYFFIITTISFLIYVYFKLDKSLKLVFILFVICAIMPLTASGSYLTSYNFSLMLGVIYLLYKQVSKNRDIIY